MAARVVQRARDEDSEGCTLMHAMGANTPVRSRAWSREVLLALVAA